MTPVLLANGASLTLPISQSQSVAFWPSDASGSVVRTATPTSGPVNVRTYGPGMFRHTTSPFVGTIKLDVTSGSIYYVVAGADPA